MEKTRTALWLLLSILMLSQTLCTDASSQRYTSEVERNVCMVALQLADDFTPYQQFGLRKTYINLQNRTHLVTYEQGAISVNLPGNHSIENTVLFDNLGNEYTPVVSGRKLMNPYFQVMFPPNFTYNLTLGYSSSAGFSMQGFVGFFNATIGPARPTVFNLTCPKNFTVLAHSPEAILKLRATDQAFVFPILQEGHTYEIFVAFVPIPTNITDINVWKVPGARRDYDLTLDVSSAFPVEGWITIHTSTRTLFPDTIEQFWDHNLMMGTVYQFFPYGASHGNVIAVEDSLGPCEEVDNPPNKVSISEYGKYIVDTKKRTLFIYPRWRKQGDQIVHQISTTFVVHFSEANTTSITGGIFDFYSRKLTYTKKSARARESFLIGNITTTCVIKMLFPENVDLRYASCSPTGGFLDIEEGRPTISWVIGHPIELPEGMFVALFEIVPLKNAFAFGFILLGLNAFAILFVSIAFTKRIFKHAKRERTRLLLPILSLFGIPSTFVAYIFSSPIGFSIFLSTPIFCLFISQLAMSILAIAILAWLSHRTVRVRARKKPRRGQRRKS